MTLRDTKGDPELQEGEGKARGRGRQGAEKVPAAKKPQIVARKLDELVTLEGKAQAARQRADDAVVAVAEESGYLSAVVKKLVKAKAGDKFEEKHREVEQQGELFDEVADKAK